MARLNLARFCGAKKAPAATRHGVGGDRQAVRVRIPVAEFLGVREHQAPGQRGQHQKRDGARTAQQRGLHDVRPEAEISAAYVER
jgi:hypothetical protein